MFDGAGALGAKKEEKNYSYREAPYGIEEKQREEVRGDGKEGVKEEGRRAATVSSYQGPIRPPLCDGANERMRVIVGDAGNVAGNHLHRHL